MDSGNGTFRFAGPLGRYKKPGVLTNRTPSPLNRPQPLLGGDIPGRLRHPGQSRRDFKWGARLPRLSTIATWQRVRIGGVRAGIRVGLAHQDQESGTCRPGNSPASHKTGKRICEFCAAERRGNFRARPFLFWEHDVEHYGDIQRNPGMGRGLWVGDIYGLDVDRMKRQFDQDRKNPPHYSIGNECAMTVHRYLQLGGGDDFASWWSRNVIGFWSPDDVEDYARSIVKATRDQGHPSIGRKYKGEGTVI